MTNKQRNILIGVGVVAVVVGFGYMFHMIIDLQHKVDALQTQVNEMQKQLDDQRNLIDVLRNSVTDMGAWVKNLPGTIGHGAKSLWEVLTPW